MTTPTPSVTKANAAGIPTADLRNADWSRIAALVLAPGVPLTHPAPHWVVELARQADVEIIGDIELFCRERRAPRAGLALRRHHRHQRQIDDDGADRASRRVGRHGRAARRQYRHRDPVAAAAAANAKPLRVHVIECSSYQIDLAPSLDPSVGILINLSEDHLDRHGTMEHYAAVKERLVAGVPREGTAIVGVDDDWCSNIADRLDQAGKRLVRVSVKRKLTDGIYVEEPRIMRAEASGTLEIAELAGIGSLRGVHNAQNAACAAAAALALGLDRCGDPGRAAILPGPRPPHGRGRPPRLCSVRQRFQGDQCRFGRAGAGLLHRHLLDRRRQAEDRRHRIACARSFRASARPI